MMSTLNRTLVLLAALIISANVRGQDAREEDYWVVENFTPPQGAAIEVGGLGFLPDGRLVVSTRRGQVWFVSNPLATDPADAKFHLFCEGLHEGLGLSIVDGQILVLQRGELSRLVDTDGDDICDRVEVVSNDWGVSGNYHEFAFGLPRDNAGNHYMSLNVSFSNPWWHGRSPVPYRGWCLKIAPDGTTTPFASGFRSPCGVGRNAEGDIFITDNQGDWMAACPVFHVKEGNFYGHPASLNWTDDYRAANRRSTDTDPPERKRSPAAVWLPYNWSRSTGNLVADETGGKFGPFQKQMFVAEVTNGTIVRVQMEKIRGEYQGACMMFRRNVGSASRVLFAPDGSLIVGRTNRGWGGQSPASGLGRLRYTGKLPMEIEEVHLIQKGFEIRFTQPVAETVNLTAEATELRQYDYNYWWEYGSPEQRTRRLTVDSASLSDDRRTLTIKAASLRAAKVARVRLNGIVGASGDPLLHDEFSYTINQLPEGPIEHRHVSKMVPQPRAKERHEESWVFFNHTDALDRWNGGGWKVGDVALKKGDRSKIQVKAGGKRPHPAHPGDNGWRTITGTEGAKDLIAKVDHGAVELTVDFFLGEGAAADVFFQGRYGIRLSDTKQGEALTPTSAGGIIPMPGRAGRKPNFGAYRGAGRWHSMTVIFYPPMFDPAGRKIRPARFNRVRIDDTLLHENIEVTPSTGAPFADEVAVGPFAMRRVKGEVALRNMRLRALLVSPDDEGWERIFNGIDIDGWKISDGGNWKVENGSIIGRGPASHLFSPRDDYKNLEFRAWCKIGDDSNSGMYFRTKFGPGWPKGYEAQVNANFRDPVKTGSLYDHHPIKTTMVIRDVWFKQHIRVQDTPKGVHVKIWLNDVLVTDHVDAKRTHASGHVAFQQHHDGSVVHYRDVEVRELD